MGVLDAGGVTQVFSMTIGKLEHGFLAAHGNIVYETEVGGQLR